MKISDYIPPLSSRKNCIEAQSGFCPIPTLTVLCSSGVPTESIFSIFNSEPFKIRLASKLSSLLRV